MAKDSSRTTAGELQKIVEFRGQKTFKKIVKQHLHHHVLFGRCFKNNSPSSSKNKLQHIQLSDMTGTSGTWDWLLWSDETKNELFSSKHSRWVW